MTIPIATVLYQDVLDYKKTQADEQMALFDALPRRFRERIARSPFGVSLDEETARWFLRAIKNYGEAMAYDMFHKMVSQAEAEVRLDPDK